MDINDKYIVALATMETMARRYNEFLRMSKLISEKGTAFIRAKFFGVKYERSF